MLESLQELLQSGGFATRAYASAEHFLSDVKRNGLAALISDIGLPGMSGLDLLRVLRAEPSDVPVILITARHDPDLDHQARELGAAKLFYKPFDTADLLATLRVIATNRP